MMDMLVLLTIFQVLSFNEAFDFSCPSQAHWKLRAKSLCKTQKNYTCLFDVTLQPKIYRDRCYRPSVVAPGFKYVFQPNLNRAVCSLTRYQPFIFETNGHSDCTFLKSSCNSEGQMWYENRQTTSDIKCFCNTVKGYTFVMNSKKQCYCNPSSEDCSCYHGIHTNNKTIDFKDLKCYEEMKRIRNRSQGVTMNTPRGIKHDEFDHYKYNLAHIPTNEYRIKAAIVVLILIFAYSIVWIIFKKIMRRWIRISTIPQRFDIEDSTTCSITVKWYMIYSDYCHKYEFFYRRQGAADTEGSTISTEDVSEHANGYHTYELEQLLPETYYELKMRFVYNQVKSQYTEYKTYKTQQIVLPDGINRLPEEDKTRFIEIMQSSKTEKRYFVRIMIVGKEHVGKTCLLRRLLKKSITDVTSTDGVNIVIGTCKINIEDGTWTADNDISGDRINRIKRAVHANQRQNSETSFQNESMINNLSNQYESILTKVSKTDVTIKISNNFPNQSNASTDITSGSKSMHLPNESENEYDKDIDSYSSSTSQDTTDDVEQLENSLPSESMSTIQNNDDIKPLQNTDKMEKDKEILKEKENTVKSSSLVKPLDLMTRVFSTTSTETIHLNPYALCGLWDFAGQKEFYATHQAFLTSSAIYLVVADICDDISTQGAQQCFAKFEHVGDYVDFWFDNIHCHGTVEQEEDEDGPIDPPVILVFTRKDKLETENVGTENIEKRKKELENQLVGVLTKQSRNRHIRKIFHLSNTKDLDGEFEQLQLAISSVAMKMRNWGQRLPLKWILLEHLIEINKENGKNFINLSDMVKLAEHGDINILDKDELLLFLRFQHEVGNIIFFQGKKCIQDLIILNPQWLVNAFRCIVSDKLSDELLHHKDWNNFRQNGQITESLITKLFESKCGSDFSEQKENLLEVMEIFDILVKIGEPRLYIVPSMMPSFSYNDVFEMLGIGQESCKRTSWLCLKFSFLPPAFFNHYSSFFIQTYTPSKIENTRTPLALFRGICLFDIDESKCEKLLITMSIDTVAVQLLSFSTEEKDIECICSNICDKLIRTTKDITQRYKLKIKYDLHFKCSTGYFHEHTMSYEDLKKVSEYFCEQHSITHQSEKMYLPWVRNADEVRPKLSTEIDQLVSKDTIDQAAFERKVKEQSSHFKDIITGINTMEIIETLSSKHWITSSEKNAIEEFHGRRQKNKALLELVLNREINSFTQFIETIVQSPTNKELGLAYKIRDLKDFLEENSHNKKKPQNVTELEEYLINYKIPEDVRNVFETYFKTWYKDDERFTITNATCVIERNLKQNNCVLVVGRSGKGKSAIIRHIALKLLNEEGYDVVPIVLDLSTILQYHDPNRKQLFVLDDFCGKVERNDQTVQMSSVNIDEVMELIKKNPLNAQGSVKLLFATQPFLFELSSFNTVDCLSKYKVLLSYIPLRDKEKIDMIKKYLPKDHDGKVPEISSHNKDIIPVLCKLSEGKTADQIIQLFKYPNKIIQKNFNELKQTNKKQICLLSLCVLFKSLTNDIFSQENTPNENEIIEVVCSEFDLDFSNKTTRLKLENELKNLEKTFLVKSSDTYYFVHKDIYDIAAVSCGTILKNSFIRLGYSSFIAERYCFISKNTKKRENVIEFDDEETLKRYFDRLMNDLEQGITYSTFHNSQLIDESYRGEFCTYCRCKKTNMVKILDRLQNRASKPAATQHDTPKSSQEERINEYEDYIDFLQPRNFSSHNMKIPLIESAWEGYKEIVEMLIYFERDVNETDKFGRSALFVACYRGMTDVVQLLLEKKANNALHEANGKSPLYVACKRGHTQIVKILIDKHDNGVITSKCDNSMYSPLHAASAEGHINIVKLLLSENNVDKCDYLGRSALFVASDNGKKGVVKSLLKGKANINECDLKGFSPLMAACSRGFLDVVEELINAKPKDIKINDQDVEGRSALFIASKKGHDKIVDFLLKHNADVLQLDCHRQSPLFIASFFGKEEIVKMLVKNVKHVNAISQSDEEDKTPLFIACEKGLEKIVDILLPECSLGVRVKTDNKQRSPLYVACRGGFIGIVKKLKSNEEQINEKNTWHETPLFAAIRGGHVDVVRYLVENNADLNTAEYNGHTPLWIACDEGHVEIVELLVEKGATINLQDNNKRTPLYAASKGNYVDVVRFLIDKSAKLDSAESNGQTPLWIACDEGHVDIVNILVDKGANINLQDNDNKTPSDIANMKGHTNIKNILKQKMLQEQKTVVKDVSE